MHRLIALVACTLLGPFVLPLMIGAAITHDDFPAVTDFHTLLEPGTHRISFEVDGRYRKMVFITPTGFKPGETLPLVFFLHGAGGRAEQAARTYGWTEKANAEHFFMAFPQGLPVHPDEKSSFLLNPDIWRDRREGMQVSGVDDVHFFSVLLDQLEAALPIDSRRIYVTGFSNGAGMTFTLGSLFSDKIAAIAPVSSQSFAKIDALARPLPVYYLTGMADPLIPYHGGMVRLPWGNTRDFPPVEETVDQWVALDGCPTVPQVVSDAHGVRVLRYGPGRAESEILFTTIEGNGHHWPDTVELLPPAVCGPTLDPFNATARIWDFFRQHPLR
jgi:polyhydroxybutyrate depolymerase